MSLKVSVTDYNAFLSTQYSNKGVKTLMFSRIDLGELLSAACRRDTTHTRTTHTPTTHHRSSVFFSFFAAASGSAEGGECVFRFSRQPLAARRVVIVVFRSSLWQRGGWWLIFTYLGQFFFRHIFGLLMVFSTHFRSAYGVFRHIVGLLMVLSTHLSSTYGVFDAFSVYIWWRSQQYSC